MDPALRIMSGRLFHTIRSTELKAVSQTRSDAKPHKKTQEIRQIETLRVASYTRVPSSKTLCPGLPRWAGTRKVKPIWILLKQETVSGSGISWAICKSAPRSRRITTPAPHHSVFYRPDAFLSLSLSDTPWAALMCVVCVYDRRWMLVEPRSAFTVTLHISHLWLTSRLLIRIRGSVGSAVDNACSSSG